MKHGLLLGIGFCALLAARGALAQVVPLPGSPLSGTFGTPIAITEPETPNDPLTNEVATFQLPGAVTPGFVVLLDPPFSATDVLHWSDVVQFSDNQAVLISDSDLQPFPDVLVTNVLAGNHQFINENRAPVTYQATGATYLITSDVEVPEPAGLGLLSLLGIALWRRR